MEKILIADDDFTIGMQIEEMLAAIGYDVVGQAGSGQEAVEMARDLKPDIILMDIVMPGELNGIEAAERIKAEWGIPIIFISGHGDQDFIQAAKQIEPYGYVMKPFDENEIRAFVEIGLHKHKMEKELKRAHEQLERTNLVLQREIEARKETERALRESEQLYRDIFERNSAIKWLLDPSSGNIVDANPAACEFYQYSHEEITKLRLWDINIEGEAKLREVLASASTGEKSEFRFRHRLASGEMRYVQVYTGTLETGGKKLLHTIIIDITDRIRAEELLKQAHDELERRVESRTAELAETNKMLQEENEARKRSEEALRESDKKLNAILDATTETIVLFDREGIVHVANQIVCNRLGTTKKEFIGKRMYDFFPPDVAEWRRQKWNEVFEAGKPVSFEDSRNGMIFAQRAFPILDDEGQVEMVASFANDKTDRKQVEDALRESEERYRNLVEESFDGIFIQKGPNIIFANKRLNEMLGYEEGELLGQKHWVVYHPDSRKLTRERARSRMNGEEVAPRYEVKLQRKDGSWFFGEINARAITFPSDQENGIQVWIKDIAERKRAEEALKDSEAFLKTLIDTIPIPVFYKGRDGKYLGFNRAFERFFGKPKEQLIGKSVFDINPPELAEIYHARDEELFNSGGVQRYESQWKNANGELRDFIFNKALFTDSKGTATGLIGTITDITERRRVEKALRESEERCRIMMEQADDALCARKI